MTDAVGAPLAGLISADEARRRLLEGARPVATEPVSVPAAAGRVLAEDVIAAEDFPRFARSAVDGYALRAADVARAEAACPVRLRLLGSVGAGDTAGRPLVPALPLASVLPLQPGEAWAVATGAQIPDGADTIVMIEETSLAPGSAGSTEVVIRAALVRGRNVIARGEDVRAGARLLERGRRLAPRDLALLAALGVQELLCARRPRVAVLSSGAELVAAGAAPTAAGVRDVNQPALAAAAELRGAQVTRAGIVGDDAARLGARLAELAAAHDLVLVSGGTSVGAADHTARALNVQGARLLFHGVAIRPGRPILAAVLGSSLVVGLPGVPTAALIGFEIFVRPILAALAHAPAAEAASAWTTARLAAAMASVVGREDHVRVRLEERGESGGWATPVGGASSSLAALAAADGVAIVPAAVAVVSAGDRIQVLRF